MILSDTITLSKHAIAAYRYSTLEEYLLAFMDKYASAHGEEADDGLILSAYENAKDHQGKNMMWYSKAALSQDQIVSVGDSVSIKDKDIKAAEIVSISDDGIYIRSSDDNYFFGSVDDDGRLIYSSVDLDKQNIPTHYLVPQYEDVDLQYKEAVKSNDIDVARKRASYILSNLEKVFPTTPWSIRIVNSSGDDIEVVESCNI